MEKYKVAVAQIHTGEIKEDNLNKMEGLIAVASENGARLICFSEMVNVQSAALKPHELSEEINGPTILFLAELAKKYNMWICTGSLFETIPNSEKVHNTSVLLDNEGNVKAVYRKMHTFDITLPNGRIINESDTIQAGESIVTVDTPFGNIGIAICYDLRFPEQFREMTKRGMQVLLLPSSFLKETGKAHWEPLIRARAIENGCYVLASNQCGHIGKHDTFGHSMIVDPWGKVLSEASDDENILFAEIDLDYVEKVRMQLPSTINE